MGFYFDDNGEYREFEFWENRVSCIKCGKTYRQVCEEQAPGFRSRDLDVCPYCGTENGSSISINYYNYKISDSEGKNE